MNHRGRLGEHGEKLAVGYLRRKRYRILKTNFRNRFGEIDIIARQGDVLCFIEVKTRRSTETGEPLESIDNRKQRQIFKTATAFLQKRNLLDSHVRFDALGIKMGPAGTVEYELIDNAMDFSDFYPG